MKLISNYSCWLFFIILVISSIIGLSSNNLIVFFICFSIALLSFILYLRIGLKLRQKEDQANDTKSE